MKDEEKNVNANQADNNKDDFSLKWGDEPIETDVSSYTYQDPTTPRANEVESKTGNVEEADSNAKKSAVSSKVEETKKAKPTRKKTSSTAASTVTASKKKDLVPSPAIEKNDVSDVSVSIESTTPPAPSLEEEQTKGRVSTILLVLLFVFLFLFIMFLPEITNYINLAKTRKEVWGNVQKTPTPSPIVPIPSATPSPSPDNTISLKQIVSRFEGSDMVKEIRESDRQGVLHITSLEDMITIDYQNSVDMVNRSSTYQLKGTILSSSNADRTTATILVEVISQLQGNKEGLSRDIFEGAFANYSLRQNGIFMEENPNQTLTIQIDLAKTLSVGSSISDEE